MITITVIVKDDFIVGCEAYYTGKKKYNARQGHLLTISALEIAKDAILHERWGVMDKSRDGKGD